MAPVLSLDPIEVQEGPGVAGPLPGGEHHVALDREDEWWMIRARRESAMGGVRKRMARWSGILVATVATGMLVSWVGPAMASGDVSNGQAPSTTWTRMIGGNLNDVAATPGGRVYVVGSTGFTGDHPNAALVRRYAPDGTRVWARAWHIDKGYAFANDVTVGPDEFVYVAGTVASTRSEGGGFLLLKYSPGGKLLWQRLTAGWLHSKSEGGSGVAVIGDAVVISGNSSGCCGDPYSDGWLRAYDTGDGHWLWTTQFEVPGIAGTNDAANAVAAGPGGFYAAGWVARAEERSDQSFVNHDAVVEKVTASGVVDWTTVVADGVRDHDAAVDVVGAADGIRVLAYVNERLTTDAFHRGHGWLRSYGADGDVMWTRSWGFTPAEEPGGMGLATDGSVVIASEQRDPDDHLTNLAVRSYDDEGTLLWSKSLDPEKWSATGTGAAVVGRAAFVTASLSNRDFTKASGWLVKLGEV